MSPIELTPSPPLATIVPQTLNNNINNNNNNNNNQKEVESPSLASPRSLDSSYEDNEDDYPEEFYEQYQHQPTGGLRERELLCPIMEEDNESTASGSTCNLATPRDNNTVIGNNTLLKKGSYLNFEIMIAKLSHSYAGPSFSLLEFVTYSHLHFDQYWLPG